jgi:phage gp29-like protein
MANDVVPVAAPIPQEVAASSDGRDITVAHLGPLAQVQDTVLAGLGGRWEAYREIRRDAQVHATFQQRRLAIVSRTLVVEPGADDAQSKAAAEHLQANLDDIAFDRATKGMTWGVFYGYAVGECMWTVRDNKVWLARVKVRTPWRFRFAKDGQLTLLTRASPFVGEPMPDKKFWVVTSGADNDDDPYGLGLAHQLYWPVYFKKMGLSFWLRALEKFGAPTAVGTFPPGTSLEDQARLLAAAMAVRIDGAVIKPEGTLLELLEAKRGTVDQATFYKFCNADISKVTLGQTMTTDDGSSLAQGKVHYDVREELTDADIEELCESFQQGPARWLTEWNFPGAAIPVLRRPSPEDAERASKLTKERADTIKIMAEAGYEPEEATLKDMFPGWRPKAAPVVPAVQPNRGDNVIPLRPAFSESRVRDVLRGQLGALFAEPLADGDAADAFIDALDWEPLIAPIADAVEQVVAGSPTLEVAAERLAEIFTGPAGAAFTEHLAGVLFQARAAGKGGLGISDREDRALAES